MNNRKLLKTVQYVILVTGVVLILLPMFLVVITAFKSNLQIADNWFSLPIPLYLDNFKELLAKPDLKYAFMNSIVIAGAFLIISTLLLPVTAYGVSRTMAGNRFMRYFYYFLIIGLFVPFQAKMIPLIMIASKLGMMNVAGIIILYIAGSTCEGVFLCAGYLFPFDGILPNIHPHHFCLHRIRIDLYCNPRCLCRKKTAETRNFPKFLHKFRLQILCRLNPEAIRPVLPGIFPAPACRCRCNDTK